MPNGNGTVQGVTADFSALHAVLGNTYGAAGRLPDLRGQFIRSWNSGANADGTTSAVDAGRVRGSNQDQDFQEHQHNYDANRGASDYGGGGAGAPANGSPSAGVTALEGGDETRPVNVALLTVIKF